MRYVHALAILQDHGCPGRCRLTQLYEKTSFINLSWLEANWHLVTLGNKNGDANKFTIFLMKLEICLLGNHETRKKASSQAYSISDYCMRRKLRCSCLAKSETLITLIYIWLNNICKTQAFVVLCFLINHDVTQFGFRKVFFLERLQAPIAIIVKSPVHDDCRWYMLY